MDQEKRPPPDAFRKRIARKRVFACKNGVRRHASLQNRRRLPIEAWDTWLPCVFRPSMAAYDAFASEKLSRDAQKRHSTPSSSAKPALPAIVFAKLSQAAAFSCKAVIACHFRHSFWRRVFPVGFLANAVYCQPMLLRVSPSGKARASQARIRGFESRHPLH